MHSRGTLPVKIRFPSYSCEVTSPAVIVVGAGIVGCTVAHELAKEGARVQVLETRRPGQGATRASAGILAPYIEGHADIFRDLGARSLEMYDEFIARLRDDSGHEILYQRNGTFELAFSDADVERLTALSATLWKQGVEARWISPAAFEEFEPLASSQAQGALLIPIHGFVGVTSLTLAAAAAAERFGAQFKSEIGAVRILSAAGESGRRADVELDVGRRSRGAGGRQLVVADHGAGRRHGSGEADPRPADSAAGRSRARSGACCGDRTDISCHGPTARSWSDLRSRTSASTNRHTDEAVRQLRDAAVELAPLLADAPMTSVRTGLRPRGPGRPADAWPVAGGARVDLRDRALPERRDVHAPDGPARRATWSSIAAPIRRCGISIPRATESCKHRLRTMALLQTG